MINVSDESRASEFNDMVKKIKQSKKSNTCVKYQALNALKEDIGYLYQGKKDIKEIYDKMYSIEKGNNLLNKEKLSELAKNINEEISDICEILGNEKDEVFPKSYKKGDIDFEVVKFKTLVEGLEEMQKKDTDASNTFDYAQSIVTYLDKAIKKASSDVFKDYLQNLLNADKNGLSSKKQEFEDLKKDLEKKS